MISNACGPDRAHQKRNAAEYDGDTDVDLTLVESLIGTTIELADLVRQLPTK